MIEPDEDKDLFDAREALKLELYRQNPPKTVGAIEALIDVKLAIFMEALADRVEQALGARP